MSWWLKALIAWAVLSPIAAWMLSRFIAVGRGPDTFKRVG